MFYTNANWSSLTLYTGKYWQIWAQLQYAITASFLIALLIIPDKHFLNNSKGSYQKKNVPSPPNIHTLQLKKGLFQIFQKL